MSAVDGLRPSLLSVHAAVLSLFAEHQVMITDTYAAMSSFSQSFAACLNIESC